jgi:cytidylate kinase
MTVIAIDGPAGAGKSSIARAVADALGFRYVDTGAMYRTIALTALDRGIDPADRVAVEQLASSLAPQLELGGSGSGQPADVRIRDPRVGAAASTVAQYPGVRSALAARQRRATLESDVVMEGRDIGTVVAPEADVKLYLTASRAVRAERRRQQLELPEDEATRSEIEQELARRDHVDSVRSDSPLKPAEDAIQIDSSDRDLGSIVQQVLQVIENKIGAR